MDKVLLLFSLPSTIEKESVRQSFLRIPEVTVNLRSAQNFLDKFSSLNVDLVNYAGAPSEDFQAIPQVRDLIVSLIQWGLYQRLQARTSLQVDWLVGDARGTQGLMGLVLGRLNFSEFLWNSSVADSNGLGSEFNLPGQTFSNLEFRIYGRSSEEGGRYKDLSEPSLDRWKLVEKCVSELGARRVVTLGPSTEFSTELMRRRSLLEFDLMELAELDPQLHWLWTPAAGTVHLNL